MPAHIRADPTSYVKNPPRPEKGGFPAWTEAALASSAWSNSWGKRWPQKGDAVVLTTRFDDAFRYARQLHRLASL